MIFGEAQHCPLCHKSCTVYNIHGAAVYSEGLSDGVVEDKIPYLICECGFIFQMWLMTQETLAEYYRCQYREAMVDKRHIEDEASRADRIIGCLNGGNPSNILDIGSSTGTLLNKLQDLYKCSVVGVEPCDVYRSYSQDTGLDIVSDIEQLNGKFDLITIIHTLEHCTEPMMLLEKAKELVAKDGELWIEVPKLNYRFSHPTVFTEETFELMLNKAGLTIERKTVNEENILVKAYCDT